MNWYYADAGQQVGPIDDTTLQQLVLAGKITADTLVWRDGMAEWRPYREMAGSDPAMATAVPPIVLTGDQVACAECGRVFNRQDTIAYGAVNVCASCKPVFLQKLSEGVSISPRPNQRALPVNADELISEIAGRGYEVRIGDCLSRGWNLVRSNFWLTVGATFLVLLLNQVGSMLPFIGIVIALVLQGPLLGGLMLFFLKLSRGQNCTVGDAFAGFSNFGRLCGTFVLMCLIIYAFFIPCGIYFAVKTGFSGTPDAFFFLLLLPGLLGALYFGIALSFALPLAADLELGPWDAIRTSFRIVSKRWFSIFAFMFVMGFVVILGVFACIVGIFVTVAIFYAAFIYLYDDIFAPSASPSYGG